MRSAAVAAVVLMGLVVAAPSRAADGPTVEPAAVRARAAVETGARFLLSAQNADGSFGSGAQVSPYAIRADIPGGHRAFRAASTGLALMALLRYEGDLPGLAEARLKAARWLVANALVKRADGQEIYAVWGLAYGLQALARALAAALPGLDAEATRATMRKLLDMLRLFQTVDGGWTYYDFEAQTAAPSGDSMSFTTATILIAMDEARQQGVALCMPVVQRAARSLQRCRTPEGTYVYSFGWRYHPTGVINRKEGSLTRTPACDLALRIFGTGIDEDVMFEGVRNLLAKRAFTRMAYHRPVPHESWFAVSGYFYLYGYYHAAEVVKRLPSERTAPLLDGLIEEVLYTRHPDGSFWDYQLYGYHKIYGTAYALLALSEFAPPPK